MISGRWLRVFLASALLLPVSLIAQNTRKVLVLQEGYSSQPGSVRFAEGLHEVLDPGVQKQIFDEYFDQDRLRESSALVADTLRKKYNGTKFDVVIGVGKPVLAFLLSHGAELWPGTPEVFIFVDHRLLPAQLPPNTTAIAYADPSASTLELALQLMPKTKRVFYVGGSSPSDTARSASAEQDFKRFADKIEFTYLSNLPLAELLERLSRLPDDSIVIYGGMEQDASGHVFIAARVCPLIAAASNAPVYGSYGTFVGCGIVGGRVLDFKDLGTQTGRLAMKILERGTASGLPVENWQSRPVVDWRQLQRWGISEKRLPAGAIVRFRIPSAWERYRWYVVTGLSAIIALLTLVIVLTFEVQKRRLANLEVKELSGRLIHASEEERKRIARELHDDISQRLAIVAIEIELLVRDVLLHQPEISASLQQTLRQLHEIIEDTHNLSHELHSARLQILGLEEALNEFSQQLARQHALDIKVAVDSIPSPLPELVAFVFYRVAQEALQNSVKHSGSNRIEVRLTGGDHALVMKITDYGSGFDTSLPGRGLGLATMQERLKLVKGNLVVRSEPGGGTEIIAEARLEGAFKRATSAA